MKNIFKKQTCAVQALFKTSLLGYTLPGFGRRKYLLIGIEKSASI